MDKKGVKRIEYTLIKHATEDNDIIRRIMMMAIPSEYRDKIVIDTQKAKGYHGNEIIVLKTGLSGREADKALEYLFTMLDKASKNLLLATLENRIQGKNILHLRIHKQYLTENKFVLWDSDESLKITIRFNTPIDRKILEKMLEEKR